MISIEDLYQLYQAHPHVETDTRKLKRGDLFIALKGPNFNGNDFVNQALDKGAAVVLLDEPQDLIDDRVHYTRDCLKTLQLLAKYHRQQLPVLTSREIPFIAITGSNGKTTTKELIHHVLSKKFRTYTTQGNLNNHIGVPLTILRIRPDVEAAVIEMGANHLHEIDSYCSYALPSHGLITNCGKAHLEGFGGVGNVIKGKGELFEFLKSHNGTGFINDDDEAVKSISEGINTRIFYGTSGEEISGEVFSADPYLKVKLKNPEVIIETRLVGAYNLSNVLAAVAVGRYFSVPDNEIKIAIESYSPVNNRSQLKTVDSNTFILDTYNANPGSMKAAVENFASMAAGRKILMLGSMMELGEESQREHQNLVSIIDKYPWDEVVLVGQDFADTNNAYHSFKDVYEAKEWLRQLGPKDTHILLKGSRSLQMEKVLE